MLLIFEKLILPTISIIAKFDKKKTQGILGVKMCKRSVKNLVRIWNALSLSISCN
jgi:hypothetical protein